MQQQRAGSSGEWRRGWTLLMAATFGLSFGAIPTATLGVFMEPLENAYGWSRATITLGLTVFALLTTPLAPFAGALVDKYGSRRVAVPGLALTGLAFAAFAFSTGSVAIWIAMWVFYSLFSLGIRSTIWNPTISRNFVSNRGLAIAVLLSGMSVAGAIAPLISHALIDNFGLKGGYLGLGLGWAGIAWLLVLFFFREPKAETPHDETTGQPVVAVPPGGLTVSQALHNGPILRIGLAVFLQSMLAAAVSVHLVPIHTSLGATRTEAASIVALLGGGAMAAKFAMGWVADRVRSGILPMAAFSLPIVGYLMLLLASPTIPMLMLATLIIGLGSGAALHMVLYLTTQYGGLLNFGKIYGTISALMGLAAGIGPYSAGLIFDMTQSYSLVFIIAIPALAVAGLAVLGLGPYPDFSSPAEKSGD